MRKLLSFFVALLVTTALWAYDFQSGDLYYNITSSSVPYTVEVTCELSSDPYNRGRELTSVTIPETITYNDITYNVTSIGNCAFYECSSLTFVSIPNSVISIGRDAFMYCYSLDSITLPNSITHIERNAFYGTGMYSNYSYWDNDIFYVSNCLLCARWQDFLSEERSLTVKNNTRLIAEGAFGDCYSLVSISFPNSVTHIGDQVFQNCFSLASIEIPNSVTHIGNQVFQKCSSLASIEIPNSVTHIGSQVFQECVSLSSISMSAALVDAGKSIFDDTPWYKKLEDGLLYIGHILYEYKGIMPANTSIQVKDGTICINEYAFSSCGGLISISIPNSLTNIDEGAFAYCSSLTSIAIPESVTSIGSRAFEGCTSLNSITIPNRVNSIANEVFYRCSKLTSVTIPNSVTNIGNAAFYDCSALTSITIPNSVVNIGEEAFAYCSSIASITIGNSVKSIAVRAFVGCSEITKINYTGDIAGWCKIRFAGFFANPFQISDKYYTHSITTLYLNDQPFNGVFPNNVDTISDYAFCGASFNHEYTDYSITIGENVKYIGSYAFEGATDLEYVYLPTTPPKLGENVFTNRRALASLFGIKTFYLPCGMMNVYNASDWRSYGSDYTRFASYTKLMYSGYCGDSLNLSWSYDAEKLTITGKGEYKPYGCTPWELLVDSIKTLEIGQGITSISDYAFDELINLNTLILPNSIEKIGEKAFSNSKKLYDIYCYAQLPPETSNNTFVNYNAFLHVPCDYQRYYTADMVFSKFTNVECISAESTTTNSVIVSPSFYNVVFTWPTVSNAGSYTLAINKDGEVFCTLTFNETGQLTGIAFVLSRNGQHHAPATTQASNGFTFTVTGLDEGTEYSYNLVIKDNGGKTLQTFSGEFRTKSTNDRIVTVEYDASKGLVTGAGTYLVGDTVTLTATPNEGYRFVRWSNNIEDNPYTFVVLDNVTLSAEFEIEKTAVENITTNDDTNKKLLHNGQLLIIRDGKTYNAQGQLIINN